MLRRPGLAGSIAAAFFVIAATLPAAAELAGGQIATVPHVANVRDLGRAPARTPVSLAFTVIYRNEAELGALIEAQSDPSSPTFHHFLSNDQFNAYFAPTPSAYAQTIATLRRAGFTISTTYSNRTLIDAVAPAAIVERYFGTEIHTVVQAGHGPAYANVRPATIPAELAATVDTIVGFDTLQKARFGTLTTPPFFAGDLPAKIGGPLDGPQGGYGPLAVAQGFDFPVQHGIDGAGHAVANVAGDVSTSDINTFFKYFGIKRTGKILRTMIQTPNSGANVEATLDVETMGSLDPGADVHLYILGNPVDQPGEDAYNTIVSDDSVDAVNSSFGVCENQDASYGKAALKIIEQGEAKGISWSASTGDGGANECNGPQLLPAVLPVVLGVGGTHLTVDSKGNYVSESAWSDGGGGISTTYALPSYQSGVKGLGSTKKRNLPDIAFPADVQDAFYYQGQWGTIGGTSWASPISVALQAEVNQMTKQHAGFSNPLIYGIFKKSQYEAFHDVTTGNNGFAAKKGYDNATGIGSIKGFTFGGLE